MGMPGGLGSSPVWWLEAPVSFTCRISVQSCAACRDPRCSPRGNPACRGTFGGRRKAVRACIAGRFFLPSEPPGKPILDPCDSNECLLCPRAMPHFQKLCPAPFPPVSETPVELGSTASLGPLLRQSGPIDLGRPRPAVAWSGAWVPSRRLGLGRGGESPGS